MTDIRTEGVFGLFIAELVDEVNEAIVKLL